VAIPLVPKIKVLIVETTRFLQCCIKGKNKFLVEGEDIIFVVLTSPLSPLLKKRGNSGDPSEDYEERLSYA
jgi:hypothetical protein